MKVKIKKLHPDAIIPKYAKDGDAGLDLTAISMEYYPSADQMDFSSTKDEYGYVYFEFGTGLAIEIPEGYVGLIFPRSSISKTAMILANSVGVVDSGYRGEIKMRFKSNNLYTGKSYKIGEKVAQLIIIPYPQIELKEVTELSDSERGADGYGSTGK